MKTYFLPRPASPNGQTRAQVSPSRSSHPHALAAATALLLFLSACGPTDDCFKSTGAVVTERRALAPGLGVLAAHDNVDLVLVQDTATYAEVQAGANLQSDIVLTRVGDRLDIYNTSTCNWARSYEVPRVVTVHTPRVYSLELRGQGNVSTGNEWRQDTVFVHMIGSGDFNLQIRARQVYSDLSELGDVILRGTAEEFNFGIGGGGNVRAEGLYTQRSYFNTSRTSTGDVSVRATDIVGGNVRGLGNLYYYGPPATTDIHVSGKGRAYAR